MSHSVLVRWRRQASAAIPLPCRFFNAHRMRRLDDENMIKPSSLQFSIDDQHIAGCGLDVACRRCAARGRGGWKKTRLDSNARRRLVIPRHEGKEGGHQHRRSPEKIYFCFHPILSLQSGKELRIAFLNNFLHFLCVRIQSERSIGTSLEYKIML